MGSLSRLSVALALVAGLAGCATAGLPSVDPGALPLGSGYVALGSSNAAGAGIPPLANDRPARCGASQVSYSRLLAQRLGLSLTDATCGGAVTASLLAPWNELPAQIDAVTPATRLVTITVGGNDLNYMGVMFASSCRAGLRNPRSLDPATGQCAVPQEPAPAAYARVEQQLVEIVAQVHARAPQARVVLVQYIALVGTEPCADAPLLVADAALARRVAAGLAEATASAARATGADLLPVAAASQDHTPCSTDPWSRGLARDYDGSQGSPWHPTAAGHAAIAQMLERLLAG